ncbi:multidrug resistance efflux transporter family protein [Desulfovibrio aerotolerans]|uniref:Multidrug resistance efflux transporter family protein n=1 Tax=Solidesulfovibrio aerotolerans TaxID=295255 RepID=A0A7C9MWS5_9BACT|nr:multidrug resistance efflux transporter family protein [Solidesulfovibrio aerotolerans]MYL84674.1 multidrug resistance efflux transporter family protein [Solidesulfovibrio aerotolerans]
MARTILLGALAALFFSSTFILNRAMSLEGGHWVWSACLRYAFMLPILLLWTVATGGPKAVVEALRLFGRNPLFWTLAGSVGFGVFYAGVTLAAAYTPGWVTATTWQATILASPLVLAFLGRRVPTNGLIFTAAIFAGIVLVNYEQAQHAAAVGSLWGVAAVLVAAVAYPLGNQMVWEARHGGKGRIPRLEASSLDAGRTPTLLLTIGSIPFWLILLAATQPPPPSAGQVTQTALVALFSGVIATTLFLRARSRAKNAYELAATDATQALEVVFCLLGETLLLAAPWPGLLGLAGIALAVCGLVLYVCRQV